MTLVSCQNSNSEVIYTDNEPFVIEMSNDSLKILQLTDLLIGSFRTVLGESTRDIHNDLASPIKYLVERYQMGFARMQNSRWRNAICMSECYIENGLWHFDQLELIKQNKANQLQFHLDD